VVIVNGSIVLDAGQTQGQFVAASPYRLDVSATGEPAAAIKLNLQPGTPAAHLGETDDRGDYEGQSEHAY
jgi:hypothetical protein